MVDAWGCVNIHTYYISSWITHSIIDKIKRPENFQVLSCSAFQKKCITWRNKVMRSPPTQYSKTNHKWADVSYLIYKFKEWERLWAHNNSNINSKRKNKTEIFKSNHLVKRLILCFCIWTSITRSKIGVHLGDLENGEP